MCDLIVFQFVSLLYPLEIYEANQVLDHNLPTLVQQDLMLWKIKNQDQHNMSWLSTPLDKQVAKRPWGLQAVLCHMFVQDFVSAFSACFHAAALALLAAFWMKSAWSFCLPQWQLERPFISTMHCIEFVEDSDSWKWVWIMWRYNPLCALNSIQDHGGLELKVSPAICVSNIQKSLSDS